MRMVDTSTYRTVFEQRVIVCPEEHVAQRQVLRELRLEHRVHDSYVYVEPIYTLIPFTTASILERCTRSWE